MGALCADKHYRNGSGILPIMIDILEYMWNEAYVRFRVAGGVCVRPIRWRRLPVVYSVPEIDEILRYGSGQYCLTINTRN